jgi:DNA-binding SARP family transcriptional activator/tetratricopeptide (TPR) repeat protein
VATLPPPTSELSIRLLGDLQVLRGEKELPFPPSKKTRALLSYLVVTGRSHRRERLCSLFWDVADDPRGALRWSLSKLRPLVNGEQTRIVADRDSVTFETRGAHIDVLELRRTVESGLADASLEQLESWAAQVRGSFLEGLELPEFHDFQAWCIAEREQVRRHHGTLLRELLERLPSEPERALPHAQTLVQIDPLDAEARVQLVDLFSQLNRRAEAEEAVRASQRLFKELGSPEPEVLRATARRLGKQPLDREPKRSPAQAAQPPFAVTGASSTMQLGDLPPIVGRRDVVNRVRESVRSVSESGQCRVLLLLGEPGVGKSRMLAEVRADAYQRGGTVVEGRAYEAEVGRPYGPFIDALQRLARQGLGDAVEQPLALLRPVGSDASTAEGSRDELFDALTRFIAERARAAPPATLLLDDVQWCDEASVALLHYLLRMARELPLLVVLAARDGELADNVPMSRVMHRLRRSRELQEIALSRLTREETAQLIAQSVPEVDARAIFEQSAGNPLFALEVARANLVGGAGGESSLRDVVRERIERLPQDAADVVRWAAVLASVFSTARLEKLVALDAEELARALETLERHALLTTDRDDYAFAHDVVRNVVYAELSSPRRKLMHRNVARALAELAERDESVAAELAHHAALAGEADVAVRACISAARRCLRVFANRDADSLSRRGLHYVSALQDEDQVTLTLELMQIQFGVRRPEDPDGFGAQLESLAQRAMDYEKIEHARLAFSMISYMRWEQGAWSAARQSSLNAEFVSRSSNDEERVMAMAEAARCLAIIGRDYSDAEAMLLEADALAKRIDFDHFSLWDGYGLLRAQQGKLDEAVVHFERARLQARRAAQRPAEFYSGAHRVMVEVQRQDYGQALQIANELLPLGQKLREGSEIPFIRAIVGLCEYALERDSGLERLEAGLSELRTVDAKYRLAFVLCHAAEVDLTRGARDLALARAREALDVSTSLDHPSEMALSRILLAQLARMRDDTSTAEEHIEALRKLLPLASAEARNKARALDPSLSV